MNKCIGGRYYCIGWYAYSIHYTEIRIISQTSVKITKAFHLLRFFNKTRASVLFLRFRFFNLSMNSQVILEFQYSVVSSFIDYSGESLVLSMVCFSLSTKQRKQAYNYKANDVGVAYNEWTNHVQVLQTLVNKSLT